MINKYFYVTFLLLMLLFSAESFAAYKFVYAAPKNYNNLITRLIVKVYCYNSQLDQNDSLEKYIPKHQADIPEYHYDQYDIQEFYCDKNKVYAAAFFTFDRLYGIVPSKLPRTIYTDSTNPLWRGTVNQNQTLTCTLDPDAGKVNCAVQ